MRHKNPIQSFSLRRNRTEIGSNSVGNLRYLIYRCCSDTTTTCTIHNNSWAYLLTLPNQMPLYLHALTTHILKMSLLICIMYNIIHIFVPFILL